MPKVKAGQRIKINDLLTHDQYVGKIIGGLHAKGYRSVTYRTALLPTGRHVTALFGDKGLPDIIAARDGIVWFIEVKTGSGRLDPDQKIWRKHLPGAYYRLVREDDYDQLMEEMK
jgi:hypothetical protein